MTIKTQRSMMAEEKWDVEKVALKTEKAIWGSNQK